MPDKRICTNFEHAELIRHFVSPCTRCGRILMLAPQRFVSSGSPSRHLAQQLSKKQLSRLIPAEDLSDDIRVEASTESAQDEDSDEEIIESDGEQLNESEELESEDFEED